MEIPFTRADFVAADQWIRTVSPTNNPQNLDFGCGDTAGYGGKTATAPLSPPTYNNRQRIPTLIPGDEQRTARVDVYGPMSVMFFGNGGPLGLPVHDTQSEWIGASNSIFHYGDIGDPLIATLNGRQMATAFCTYGHPTEFVQGSNLYYSRWLYVESTVVQTVITQGLQEAQDMRMRQTGVTWP